VDPREEQESFQCLDSDAQDLRRQAWLEEEVHQERLLLDSRRCVRTAVRQGVLALAGIQLAHVVGMAMVLRFFFGEMMIASALGQIGVATVAGALLGRFWSAVSAGVMICLLSSMGAMVAVEVLILISGMGDSAIPLVTAPLMAGWVGQYVGSVREQLPGS